MADLADLHVRPVSNICTIILDREIGRAKKIVLSPTDLFNTKSDIMWIEKCRRYQKECTKNVSWNDAQDAVWLEVMMDVDDNIDGMMKNGAWRSVWNKNKWSYLYN